VGDGYNGLVIVDVSNPASPTLKGSYNTAGSSHGVAVEGNYAYVADDSNGLVIVDVANQAAPTLKGRYDTAGYPERVAVEGNYAYVADYANGLAIVDVSNPAEPTLKGTYNNDGYFTSGVDVVGNYAYIGALKIVDVSNPLAPKLKGSYNNDGGANEVAVAGNYTYVADGYNGLAIFDVSNPSSPILKGNYDTAGYSEGVAVAGNYTYVADDSNGLEIFRIDILPVLQTSPTILISTDKSSYKSGNKMIVSLNLTNPGAITTVRESVWVDMPGGGKHMVMDNPSLSLSAGFKSSNKFPVNLPNIPSGNYAWHAVLKNSKSEIISESIAPWTFTGTTVSVESFEPVLDNVVINIE
jgi:hypothetical protein